MLEELAGRWEGDGRTFEDAPFKGTLDLDPLAGGRGIAVAFRAVAPDGSVLCRHRGILAGERLAFLDDAIGELKILDRRADYVFGSGDPSQEESYRLEVSFEVAGPGELDLTITSGLPGQPFSPRLRAHLVRSTPPE
ncbi:MAG TPA: hypothetical protein VFY93_00320 [Planctomycetota bacterium]|nr:hypothetical protein [Planctomycetota bacterium]